MFLLLSIQHKLHIEWGAKSNMAAVTFSPSVIFFSIIFIGTDFYLPSARSQGQLSCIKVKAYTNDFLCAPFQHIKQAHYLLLTYLWKHLLILALLHNLRSVLAFRSRHTLTTFCVLPFSISSRHIICS